MKISIGIIVLLALLHSTYDITTGDKEPIRSSITITHYSNYYRPDSLLDKVIEHIDYFDEGRHFSKEVTVYIYTHTIKEGKLTCTKKQEVLSNGEFDDDSEYIIYLEDGQEIFTLNEGDTLFYELKKYNKQGQPIYEKNFTRRIKVPYFNRSTELSSLEKEFCYDDYDRLYFQRTHIKDYDSEMKIFSERTAYRGDTDEIASKTHISADSSTSVILFNTDYSADTLIQYGYCNDRLLITIKTLPNYREEITYSYNKDGTQDAYYNIIKDDERIEIYKKNSEVYIGNTRVVYTDSLFYKGGLLILDKHSSPLVDSHTSIKYDNKGNKTLERKESVIYGIGP